MASELVALVRQLCGGTDEDEEAGRAGLNDWESAVRAVVAQCAEQDLAAVAAARSGGQQDEKALWRAIAAFSVLGGFNEPLRVGCRVVVSVGAAATAATRAASEADLSNEIGELHVGTLVAYEQGRRAASVVFEDESRLPVTVDVDQLTAVPDVRAAQAGFMLSPGLLKSLVAFFGATKPSDADASASEEGATPSAASEVHVAQLRSRSMRALWSLLQDAASARLLMSGTVPGALDLLLAQAQKSQPGRLLDAEEATTTLLLRRALDLSATQRALTRNAVASTVRARAAEDQDNGMKGVLPHFKHAHLAQSLPTAFSYQHCA